MATSQMCNLPNGNFPKVRFIGSLRRRRVQWRPRAAARMDYWGRALWLEQAGGRLPRLLQTWEVAAWEILHLGSCHLRKYSWEKSSRKVSNIQCIQCIVKKYKCIDWSV